MTQLPEPLVAYLEQRDTDRANAVTAKLASLTDWERALIKDAAAMGYVQGMRHPQGEEYPGDVNVLPLVIDACLSPAFADLYPAINTNTKPTETEQRTLTYERSMYAAAIRQLILQVRQTAYVWSTTLPETIPTAEVAKALSFLCSPVPLPEDLRDDLWQQIAGAYYVRFENDGHPEDAQAAADIARNIVQPELEDLRAEVERLRGELEQARNEAGR